MSKSRIKDEAVQGIYRFYCGTFARNPNKYKLSATRRKLIRKRLRELPADDIIAAIRNLAKSAFHVDQGYVGLDFILRNYEKVEEWRDKGIEELRSANRQYFRKNPEAKKIITFRQRQKAESQKNIRLLQAEKQFSTLPEADRERLVRENTALIARDSPSVCQQISPEIIRNTAIKMAIEELANA